MNFHNHEPKNGDFAAYVEKLSQNRHAASTVDHQAMSRFARGAARWVGGLLLVLGWVLDWLPLPLIIFGFIFLTFILRKSKHREARTN